MTPRTPKLAQLSFASGTQRRKLLFQIVLLIREGLVPLLQLLLLLLLSVKTTLQLVKALQYDVVLLSPPHIQ